MELLPAIANYFEVTVDYLLGMDKIRSREEIKRSFTKVFEHERNGKYKEAVLVLREAQKTYPEDDAILCELALALSKSGVPADKSEAIRISERILEKSTNEKIRSTVKANLCFLYRDTGDLNKAESFARTLPHIWECREIHLREFVSVNERECISDSCLNIIQQVIADYVNNRSIAFSLGYKAEDNTDICKFKDVLK